jgi:uncharacterized membrane protein YdjX (TVP38/TMEM64 family)
MLQTLRRIWRPSISDSLANAFSRLGWIGFWIQVAIGRIPLTLIVYAFIFGRNAGAGTRGGLLLVGYLTIARLLVLVFLAERIADSTPICILGAASCMEE